MTNFDASWLGQEPGQLSTQQIKACVAWLDRAFPSLQPADKAKYLVRRDHLQAEFRRRLAKKQAKLDRKAAKKAKRQSAASPGRPAWIATSWSGP